MYNNDNEASSWKGALNRYLPAPGTTLASYWSSIQKTAVHSPHRQSANYRLHNRRPAGSEAVFTSPASRAGETTLSQNHNYDEYGRRFMATPLFLVMWGRRGKAIRGDETARPCLRLWKTVWNTVRWWEGQGEKWTFISVGGKGQR